MSAAPKSIDKKSLQVLVPFNALSPAHFNEVMQKTQVDEYRAGRVVFKEGERDNQSVYLLKGELNLLAGNDIVGMVKAGSDAARHPVAQQQPRQVTARAKTSVIVARVDSSLLDIMLTWDQSSGYEVAEIDDDEDGDWMTRILQSQAFLKLPPSNIQRLLMSVESMPVRAGEIVIQQGGEGDYFYIIKTGRCMVTRRPSQNAKEVKLAELTDGDAFGEDALVSDAKRNATVTMLTDGVLMRLAKANFNELLKEPLLAKVKFEAARALLTKGAELLDVRLPGEFENFHIADSRNIPLSALRLEANSLARTRKYIVCCDTGRRSASAAFILGQRGFDVFVLEDGFASVPPEAQIGDAPTPGGALPDTPPAPVVTLRSVPTPAPAPPEGAAASAETATQLEARIEALQAAQTAAEAARDQAQARLAELQGELEQVRTTAREQTLELEQTLSEARTEGTALSVEMQRLKEELRGFRQADKASREQAEALEAEVAERRERETALRAEISALHEQRAQFEAAVAGNEQAHTDAAAELAALRERIAALEPLEQQLQAQRSERELLEEAKASAEAAAREVQEQLSTASTELAQLREDHHALQRTLAETQGHAQQLASDGGEQAQRLAAELDTMRATVAATEQERSVLQDTLVRLQAETAAAQARVVDLEQATQAQTDAAEGRLEAVRRELDTVRVEFEQAQAAWAEERAGLTDAETGRASARADLETEHAALQAELQVARADLEAARTGLEAQLAEATAAHARALADQEATQQDAIAAYERRLADAEVESAARIAELEETAQAQADAVEGRLEAVRRELDTARVEFEQAQAAWAEERAGLTDAEAGRASARADLEAEHAALQAELQVARADLEAARAELEAQLAEAAAAHARALADQGATQQDAIAAYERQLADAAAETARIAGLEQALHDAQAAAGELAGQAARLTALEEERDRLHGELASQAELIQEAGTARTEIEARLAEMSAAAEEAQAQLEQAQRERQQAVTQAEERLRTELGVQLRDLKSDLDGARAALAREQSLRHNLAAADQSERDAALVRAAEELDRVQTDLDAARHSLEQNERERRALEDTVAAVRDEAETQRQALTAELEQLRMVTSADIDATRRQMASLQEELDIARKARAESSADNELSRLRMLLDEAREEASSAHSDAEQWREQAFAAGQSQPDPSDELDALRIQLADVQVRIDDALRLRDAAQQEVSGLRRQIEDQRTQGAQTGPSLTVSPPGVPPARPEPTRGGGLWAGLAVGLLIGLLGAAGLFWYGGGLDVLSGIVAIEPPVAAPPPAAEKMTQPAPVEDEQIKAAAKPVTKPVAKPVPKPVAEPVAEPAQVDPIAAVTPPIVRTFRDEFLSGGSGPVLVEIAAATFTMGGSASSLEFDERPQHEVRLQRFAIGRYETTFDEYDTFARATGRMLSDDEGWGRGDRPVINVSWEDATAYAHWLSEQTGKRYRLPSEAEWEYAAAGGRSTPYPRGNGHANCFNCGSTWDARFTAPVGSFAPNPYGLYDTAGNVAEWIQDCYHANYEGAPADGRAWVSADCSGRVLRGGGFNSPATSVHFSKRDQRSVAATADDVGFRIARDL
ncbi:MAG: SUMF1/EgtB/PvdO family nonheme iron enzyme [Gammaproteobacteria bacterium]|nr:SUMF1/EgtB/PvdO family nonheme iron enzyme [Gammaproteobacteria bacterium]